MKTIYLYTNKQITERNSRKIIKKLNRKNKDKDIVVALSQNLAINKELQEKLFENKIKVLNGRWLFKFLICDAVKYIIENRKEDMQKQNVSFLLDEADDIVVEQIIKLAKKVKSIKIISDNLNRFNYIEEMLYNEYGIAIQVTNNKKKSLINDTLIVNVDFKEEKIKDYTLNPCAIVINIKNAISVECQDFKGTIINYYEVEYDKENFVEPDNAYYFENNILYESYIYRRDTFSNIYKQLKRDNVRIVSLI